ncbi:hypothetical protein [Mangrovimonas sp. YM274]|uniref:hypothetical protein n=1 Tax=Mangrovimonas sp. YM274 TaxID=3070660 RepID=UPI0027DAC6C9|nr:hypothetical protein [Mangrovimonas sp. YM274]WMI67179.1 hypothetical protein RBH95_08480 [Mangrovimonas sp. YM274]
MKKLLLLCSLFVGTSALVSCSSDDDSSDGGGDPVATSITLTADVTSIELGSSVTLSVMNDLDEDVTGTSTYFASGATLSSNVFTPTAGGEYTIHATNGELVSNTITVTVDLPLVEASDSFVIDGTQEYTTNTGAFAFAGATETNVVVMYFNPYESVDNGDGTFSYPNDLYIGIGFQTEGPTGTNPDTGEAAWTLEDLTPPTGDYTWYGSEWDGTTVPGAFEAFIIANSEDIVGFEDDQTIIESVVFNLATITWPTETEDGLLEATYTITLTDGTVIEGEYSGASGIYSLQSGRPGFALDVPASTLVSKTSNLN